MTYLSIPLALPIWAVFMGIGGGLLSALAGVILALAFIPPWLGSCLMRTIEHRQGYTHNCLTIVWPRSKGKGWSYLYFKVSCILIFALCLSMSTLESLEKSDPQISPIFPIVFGTVCTLSILYIEYYCRRHYTTAHD